MADKRRRFVYVTDGHAVDGKVPAGEVPESWRCVDCGVDTAPGIMNRVELERALAAGKASGSGWDCVASIEQTAPVCGSGGGVEQVIDFESEVYCVRAVVWKAARMKPFGGVSVHRLPGEAPAPRAQAEGLSARPRIERPRPAGHATADEAAQDAS